MFIDFILRKLDFILWKYHEFIATYKYKCAAHKQQCSRQGTSDVSMALLFTAISMNKYKKHN